MSTRKSVLRAANTATMSPLKRARKHPDGDAGNTVFAPRRRVLAVALAALLPALAVQAETVQGKRIDNARTEQRALPPPGEWQPQHDYPLPSGVSRTELQTMRTTLAPARVAEASRSLSEADGGALFASGYADLTATALTALDALVEELRERTDVRIAVAGHTDSQRLSPRARARFGDNQGLSEARALAVAQYLRSHLGLPAEAVSIAGYGPQRPVGDNGEAAGMARNRRVEIQAWYTQAQPAPAPVATPVAVAACAAGGDADLPFRITVDGEPLDSAATNEADRQRCVDVALERADIQVKYDDLAARPSLNVWVEEDTGVRGDTVHFRGYSNYVAWIRRAELRVFRADAAPESTPLAVLPLGWEQPLAWAIPTEAEGHYRGDYRYLLRVYDEQGRFDETAFKTLSVSAQARPLADRDTAAREALTGWGENALALRNIPVRGGTITVSGRQLGAGQTVQALGLNAPVDAGGRFVLRQILPAGPQEVLVQVTEADGRSASFRRNVTIPADDWFYIAVADLTAGRNAVNHRVNAALVTGDDGDHYRNETYIDGRGAFYLKGKIKGEWLLTAAADTREQPLEDLFSNFSSKDPRYLLRSIDPDAYYPVYGDDSTTSDDAPTQGKFYVRLERGDSHVMWGNFRTGWTGSELVQYSRGLYGAQGRYVSEQATSFGERRTAVEGFAADPGTLPAREEFRGTGGSLYYLRHQDVTEGSEQVWAEVRDQDSGLVIERRMLIPAQDYDVNYLQGRILLRTPLPSTASGGLVYTSAVSGNPLHLVVNYEYVPGMERVDSLALGGRATHWLNDKVRVGVTSFRQGEDAARQTLQGGDILLRVAPGTSVRAELARSEGAADSLISSVDGGYGFNQRGSGGGDANARRIETTVDLSEITDSTNGTLSAYWQDREAGYTGPGQIAINGEAVTQTGARAEIDITERDRFTLKADLREGDLQDRNNIEAGWRRQLAAAWALTGGVRGDERSNTAPGQIASARLAEEGQRTDVIARLDYQPRRADGAPEDWEIYGFTQGTAARTEARRANNRGGVGGAYQVNDRLRLKGEASDGNGGAGGLFGGDYRVSDRSNVYLNYVLETDNPEYAYRGRHGVWVNGADYRVSETTRVFGENRLSHGAGPQSLTHAFGVDLAPADRWTLGVKFETGRISDPLGGDFKRNAGGVSAGYRDDRLKYASSLEYREDRSDSGTGRTWLTRNSLGYQLDPSWRLLGKANVSRASNTGGTFWDGDYHEYVAGAAYRPIDNDRWNTLVKYTNFHNVPSSGQVAANGLGADYAQRSQVFSVDTIWDALPWLSLGAKYGLRIGELKFTNPDSAWFSSRADLLVLRADWHFVREWDAVLEWRTLRADEAEDARDGALVAIYRHLGKHMKAGVGYNFTDYSDDLTDLSYRSRGWFLNVLATY